MTGTEQAAAAGPSAGGAGPRWRSSTSTSPTGCAGQDRRALQDVSFQIGRQRVLRAGRRVRLRQVHGGPRADPLPAAQRPGQRRLDQPSTAGTRWPWTRASCASCGPRTVSMVYQEPGRALNPSIRVGRQVAEVFEIAGLDRKTAMDRAEAMLRKVQISDPGRVMEPLPAPAVRRHGPAGRHRDGAGRRARAADPGRADHRAGRHGRGRGARPGRRRCATEFATSVLFISHNLAVIAKMCDRVGVLYAGELVEQGPAQQVFDAPRHPYTVGLLRCIPRRGQRKDHGRLDTIPGFLPAARAHAARLRLRPALPDRRGACREAPPPAFDTGPGRTSRCYLPRAGTADLPRTTPDDRGRCPDRPRDAEPVCPLRDAVQDLHGPRSARRCTRWSAWTSDLRRGRDARPGRRVGQRQDHAGPGAARADRRRTRASVVELDGPAAGPDAPRSGPREQLKALQIVFQNPDSALNRRHTVRRLISRPLTRLAGLSGARLQRAAGRPGPLGPAGGAAPAAAARASCPAG